MNTYKASKRIHYESCPDCWGSYDMSTVDTDDDYIVGCCDHLPLDALLKFYEDEMRHKVLRAMIRLDIAANPKNK